ncbi:MAG: YceI family protein, partial [Caldilineaceae bacterium]|nr:YceI family protein [Caldilineaceae bacterium]
MLLVGCGRTPTPEEEPAASSSVAQADSEPTATIPVEPTPTSDEAAQTPAEASSKTLFYFDPTATEARFLVDEILLGQDKTVIGVTSLVTGFISVDLADPTTAQVGQIEIDARDFATDSRRRNTSISRYILQSVRDEYRYITFEPTAIEGLPEAVAVGGSYEFNIIGDLTIRDITRPETFTTTVTLVSDEALEGLAVTTVTRADYDLTIPSVPSRRRSQRGSSPG